MNDYNVRRLGRATRVQTFGRERAADFTVGGKAATFFGELDTVIAAITRSRVGQLRGPVGKQEVIEALGEDFKDIARTTLTIALNDPAFSATPYRHPAPSVETPVATHADSILPLPEDQPDDDAPAQSAKAALCARFTAYELPAAIDNLLAQAQSVITRLDAAVKKQIRPRPRETRRLEKRLQPPVKPTPPEQG